MTEAVRYDLNTAITAAIDPATGKFHEEKHRELTLPVRSQLMMHDGITGCHIDRYALRVDYLPNVTSPQMIDTIVTQVMAWAAAEDGLFPLRGAKTPTATREQPKPSRYARIVVVFSTNIVRLPFDASSEGWNEAVFRKATQEFVTKMTDTDGLTTWQLRICSASVTFNKDITTEQEVIAHLRRAFDELRSHEGFFPYLGDHSLDPIFKCQDV